ncbi:MAG: hypothetical protein J0L66_05205 [Cytophagales bacterium]|nr:hypothetical protein [Cytophagales bacterium]
MKIEIRKYQLIERVMTLNENQLEKLESFLAQESGTELSVSLDRALQQVKEGKVTPHTQVRKKYEKWL